VAKILGAVFDQAPSKILSACVSVIEGGGVLVAATETGFCYFGCSGKKSVLEKFLVLREAHPKTKPFSLMFGNISQVAQFAELQTPAYRLLSKLLPGPFTVVLPSNRHTPQNALVKTKNTVGVRLSQNALITELCLELKAPLLVSSVTDNDELNEEHYFDSEGELWQDAWWAQADTIDGSFGKKVEIIIDPGEPIFLKSSTVLDFSNGSLEVLRNSGWEMEV
jgi:tRNA threonylcarbamoyl adenosine modification protein (Sua5/YciO/YrdC/YwlC family)